jgi:hypothetical protein
MRNGKQLHAEMRQNDAQRQKLQATSVVAATNRLHREGVHVARRAACLNRSAR